MATATGNYPADNSSLANFKSWAQAISNAFSTFGWTQTTDTGQVNWSTIAAVPSSAYVYEIWKANDTQAATLPIYVKMEYGFSSSNPALRYTVGTSSNGSGTITGQVGFSALLINNSNTNITNQGGTTYPCYFSGDAGEFRMLMWQGNNYVQAFGIERSKDNTGAKTTDYVTMLAASGQCASNTRWLRMQTITSSSANGLETVFPSPVSSLSTGSFGGTVAAYPIFPIVGKVGNPMLGWMSCLAGDVADGISVAVASIYGGTHTVMASKGGSSASSSSGFGAIGMSFTSQIGALLMRYE